MMFGICSGASRLAPEQIPNIIFNTKKHHFFRNRFVLLYISFKFVAINRSDAIKQMVSGHTKHQKHQTHQKHQKHHFSKLFHPALNSQHRIPGHTEWRNVWRPDLMNRQKGGSRDRPLPYLLFTIYY